MSAWLIRAVAVGVLLGCFPAQGAQRFLWKDAAPTTGTLAVDGEAVQLNGDGALDQSAATAPAVVMQALPTPVGCSSGGLQYSTSTNEWFCADAEFPTCDNGYVVAKHAAGATSYECKAYGELLARPDCIGSTPVASFDMASSSWSCEAVSEINQACGVDMVLTTNVSGQISCVDKDRIASLPACQENGGIVHWSGADFTCVTGDSRYVLAAGDTIAGNIRVHNAAPEFGLDYTGTTVRDTWLTNLSGSFQLKHQYQVYNKWFHKWLTYNVTPIKVENGRVYMHTMPYYGSDVVSVGYFHNTLGGGLVAEPSDDGGEDSFGSWVSDYKTKQADTCNGDTDNEYTACPHGVLKSCQDSKFYWFGANWRWKVRQVTCRTKETIYRLTTP